MKQLITTLLLSSLLLMGSVGYGQTTSFRKGELAVNPGLALGLIGYGYGYYGTVGFAVPITVNVHYGVTENISAGAYAGYMGRSYGPAGYRDRFTALSFGAQGSFHATAFLNENLDMDLNEEKLDLYAKVIFGLETRFWSNEGGGTTFYDNGFNLRLGPVLGARYLFNPRLGVYAEGGRGNFGLLTLGLSFRI